MKGFTHFSKYGNEEVFGFTHRHFVWTDDDDLFECERHSTDARKGEHLLQLLLRELRRWRVPGALWLLLR